MIEGTMLITVRDVMNGLRKFVSMKNANFAEIDQKSQCLMPKKGKELQEESDRKERISKGWAARAELQMPDPFGGPIHRFKTEEEIYQGFANGVFDKIIEALDESVYQYTIDSDVCGSGCCSEKVELIDVDEFKRVLREKANQENDDG